MNHCPPHDELGTVSGQQILVYIELGIENIEQWGD